MTQVDELLSLLMQPQTGALNLPNQGAVANSLIGPQYAMMDDPRAVRNKGTDQFGNQPSGGGGAGGGSFPTPAKPSTVLDQIRQETQAKQAAEQWRKSLVAPKPEAPSSIWSPENVERLKTLRIQNTPIKDIANELGVTPNAIAGKLNRLRGYLSDSQLKAKGLQEQPVQRGPSAPRPFDPSLWE